MGESMEIGLREVYDAVNGLAGEMRTAVTQLSTQAQQEAMERELLKLRVAQLEKEKTGSTTSRPVWWGVGASLVAAAGAYLAPFLAR